MQYVSSGRSGTGASVNGPVGRSAVYARKRSPTLWSLTHMTYLSVRALYVTCGRKQNWHRRAGATCPWSVQWMRSGDE